ncbi:MAG: FAD-binding protein [Treponema sp.]|jgi:electron transfer flavoprotein alpha subunit|nr:FAD-binding protein [Treponema sp.]
MTFAFVLSQADDPAASLLWNLIAPVREAEDRVEFWLFVSESWPSARSFAGDPWNIRHTESRLRLLERLCEERRPDLILLPGIPAGHELGVRLSARLNCGCFPETRALIGESKRLFARKKVCGSNLDGDAEIADYPAILTVIGKRAIPESGESGLPQADGTLRNFMSLAAEFHPLPEWILDYEQSESLPSNPLETAPLIFAAGRGLGNKAACDRLRRVAGRFGAPLGFSRPAALNGWGETREIIGQSGVRCGAEVCVALGVSGAAAFMTGIESASTLIAVNPDKNAPIFRYADIGILASAEEFIAALEAGTADR